MARKKNDFYTRVIAPAGAAKAAANAKITPAQRKKLEADALAYIAFRGGTLEKPYGKVAGKLATALGRKHVNWEKIETILGRVSGDHRG